MDSGVSTSSYDRGELFPAFRIRVVARASLTDVDPNLIFELLGTVNTVEVR
jgi:hypothetical protein